MSLLEVLSCHTVSSYHDNTRHANGIHSRYAGATTYVCDSTCYLAAETSAAVWVIQDQVACYLAAGAVASKAILLLTTLLPFFIAPGQGEVALCDLLPSWDVMQGSKLNTGVVNTLWGVKVVKPGHIRHAVMVQKGRCVIQAAASDLSFSLHSNPVAYCTLHVECTLSIAR